MGAAAAWALGRLGDERAVEPLVGALSDEDDKVRAKAAAALERLGWKAADEDQKALYLIAVRKWDKLAELGAAAEGPLTARLRDEDPEVREGAQWILNELKSARELDSLFKSLE